MFDPENVILCPFCKFECTHMQLVNVYPVKGDTLVVVSSSGISITSSDAAKRQRGSTVEIEFSCEQGHRWVLSFTFHKGSVYGEIIQFPDQEMLIDEETGDEIGFANIPDELWRS